MRKIISIILVICMMFALSSCGIQYGDIDKQEESVLSYTNKYFGAATIINKQSMLFNRATMFTLVDDIDEFEYTISAMEVYMSDLGFESDESVDDTTIVIEGHFFDTYLECLMQNKVNTDKLNSVLQKYENLEPAIIVRQIETVTLNVLNDVTSETAFIMNELDENAVRALAKIMKDADDRNLINRAIIPIYNSRTTNTPIAYYDFYFDYIFTEKESSGIEMLRDYLYNIDVKSATIESISLDVDNSSINPDDGFVWLDDEKGTYITFAINDILYEFHTALGVTDFNSNIDKFGIHEGSFLDIMASERTGAKPVYIGMYATMYPNEYQNLSVFCREVKEELTE